jgi:hypothetical protein
MTNRGAETYSGSLSFYRAKAEPWNPVVDGSTTANGRVAVSIPAWATRTLKVTGGADIQSGFAAAVADTVSLTSFLEGNLTYFVKSGSTVTDSVGVTPSAEFYLATVPFEDLLTIALAMICRAPGVQSATVRLTVFSQTNVPVAARTVTIGQSTGAATTSRFCILNRRRMSVVDLGTQYGEFLLGKPLDLIRTHNTYELRPVTARTSS